MQFQALYTEPGGLSPKEGQKLQTQKGQVWAAILSPVLFYYAHQKGMRALYCKRLRKEWREGGNRK